MRAIRQETGRSLRLVSVLVLTVLALGLLVDAGGCSFRTAADAKKELERLKKEKPKPNFSQFRVFTEPNEKSFTDPKEKENQRIVTALKPGHWTSILVETKANNFDFSGEMVSTPQDQQQNPIGLEGSSFRLVTSRPVALPKGQQKSLETLFFAPRSAVPRTSTWIANRLHDRRHGEQSQATMEPILHMPSFQYFLVVLARDRSRWGYLKVLDCVRPPAEFVPINAEEACYYRVLLPRTDQPLALPTQSLCWTNIAYLVWDDVLPTALSPEQQQALLDWLHWGGGLIISGPQTLDALRGTFLEPYLPATAAATTQLDAAALAELNAHWTVAEQDQRRTIEPAVPWSGITLARHPAAEFVNGTGGLVAERRVGRGRVVVTAFHLNEPDLIQWKSYDSFFNACILRRPHRRYDVTRGQFDFVGPRAPERWDPAVVSNVRYLTRDSTDPAEMGGEPRLHSAADDAAPTVAQEVAVAMNFRGPGSEGEVVDSDSFDALKAESGVAAWNDFSWVSSVARKTLRNAAGISVPKRAFVLWMIGSYLVLIVPVNWLVFRLIGRVEWAWVAVPVAALGWGMLVVWLAQLDIGFARAETEIAVLEVQPDFSRAHLTRYTALYSSLSTSYDVHFDDPSAVAQPFSVDWKLLRGQAPSTVALRTTGDRSLDDYLVSSNSTGMLHSEQMFNLGGSLSWHGSGDAPATLENNTHLRLSGVAIVRCRLNSRGESVAESAWVGDLPPGGKVVVTFQARDERRMNDARDQSPLTRENPPDGGLSLRRLIDGAQDHQSLRPGDVRLVAWQARPLVGMRIEPAASQARRATLVVAQLQFSPEEPPGPDVNLRTQALPIGDPLSE